MFYITKNVLFNAKKKWNKRKDDDNDDSNSDNSEDEEGKDEWENLVFFDQDD